MWHSVYTDACPGMSVYGSGACGGGRHAGCIYRVNITLLDNSNIAISLLRLKEKMTRMISLFCNVVMKYCVDE